jgi:TP901 family phage tail tape measure protein
MAGGALGDLVARLRVDTTALDEANTKAKTWTKTLLTDIGPVGLAMGAVTVGAIAIGVESVRAASKFQDSTAQMQNNAGITAKAAAAIGEAFLGTGFKSEFSAQQMMEAYGPVAGQLGLTEGHALSATEALGFMTTATDLAAASGRPLATVTAALAQVMQTYRIPLKDVADTTDVLYNTSRLTATPIEDITTAVDKLHTKLGPLAPSLADVAGFMLDLQTHGVAAGKGLLAATTGLSTLLSGTKPVNTELAKLGVTLFDANGTFVGFASVLDQVAPKLAGMTEKQRLATEQVLFGKTANKVLDETILAGLPGLKLATDAVDKHGTVTAGAAVHSQTLAGKTATLTAGFDDLKIRLGDFLLPVMDHFVSLMNDDAIPAILGIGSAFQAMWTISYPMIQALNLAFNALVVWPIQGAIGIINYFTTQWQNMSDLIQRLRLPTFFADLKTAVLGIPADLAGVGNAIFLPFKTAFHDIAHAWNSTVGRLHWDVPGWIPGIGGNSVGAPTIPEYHMGGIVAGLPGSEVLAKLRVGEMVLTPAQQQAAVGGGLVIMQGSPTYNLNGTPGEMVALIRAENERNNAEIIRLAQARVGR